MIYININILDGMRAEGSENENDANPDVHGCGDRTDDHGNIVDGPTVQAHVELAKTIRVSITFAH